MTLVNAHPIPGFAAHVGALQPWESLGPSERLHGLGGIVPEARPYFERLIHTATNWGMRPWIISALRTCAEQDGLSQSAVRSCKSWHTLGRAIDVQLQSADGKVDDREPYEKLGVWWESIGGTWGGRWIRSYPDGIEPFRNAGPGDVVHFQWTPPPLTTSVPPTLCDPNDCQGTVDRYLAAEWRKPSGHYPERWARGSRDTSTVAQWVAVAIGAASLFVLLRSR